MKMNNTDIQQGDFGALALAFLGDSVIESKVREVLVRSSREDTGALTETAHKYTCAVSQSERTEKLLLALKEEEESVFLRARNHKSKHPHSSTAAQYKRSTGFEAVFGWLKLKNDEDRIKELFEIVYDDLISDCEDKKRDNL